jgi:hypothetical protein
MVPTQPSPLTRGHRCRGRAAREVPRPWIQGRADGIAALVGPRPGRARVEIRKHLDGHLELVPGADRHIELRGRVKPNSLLVAQEAVGGFSPGFGCGGALCAVGKQEPPVPCRGPAAYPATLASAHPHVPVRPRVMPWAPPSPPRACRAMQTAARVLSRCSASLWRPRVIRRLVSTPARIGRALSSLTRASRGHRVAGQSRDPDSWERP